MFSVPQGPFVHVGSVCATLLCKFMSLFSSIYKVFNVTTALTAADLSCI